VEGNLRAAERLEVTATGAIRGDAAAPRIALQEGAAFNGSIETLRAGESRSLAQMQAGGAAGRNSAAPRGSRFQTAQAAGAAAAAGAVATPSNAPSAAPEALENTAAAAPTVLLRGIATDSSEHSD